MNIWIDFDDVLIESAKWVYKYHNNKIKWLDISFEKQTKFLLSDIPEYPHILQEEANDFFSSAIQADEDKLEFEIREGAIEWLKKLKEAGHKLYVITWRGEPEKRQWELMFERYFKEYFEELIFAHHFWNKDLFKHKSDICKEKWITVFLDDAVHNVKELNEVGIKCYLFKRPWNERENYSHKLCENVLDWNDFMKKFDK